jgi:rare lipoprotein A
MLIAAQACRLAATRHERRRASGFSAVAASLLDRLAPLRDRAGSVLARVGPLADRLASLGRRVGKRRAALVVAPVAAVALLLPVAVHLLRRPEAPPPPVAAAPAQAYKATEIPPPPDPTQTGVASWYGRWHHGKPTATGESFNMNAMTAAHRSLPLDSRVRVTNLENGKSIEVRVNDRGPYVDGRVLDLSAKAAERLDMKQQGLARVKIEKLPD